MPKPALPPEPEQMPTPMVELATPETADTEEQLGLPEGFTAIRRAGVWASPIDRRGQLRQIGDAWWDAAWIDGRPVLMLCTMEERGLRCWKPKEFQSRKECGAYDLDTRDWCTKRVGTCQHCVDWSTARGMTCQRPIVGRVTRRCGIHRQRPGKLTKLAKIEDFETLQNSELYPQTLSDAQKILWAAAQKVERDNLEPEIDLLRTKLANLNLKFETSGETQEAWDDLKAEWQRFLEAKSEKDRGRAIDKITSIIYGGACAVAHEREVINLSRAIDKLVKTNQDIQREKEKSMNTDQVIAILSAIVAAATETWRHDTKHLAIFREKVASVSIPNIPIEVKVLE